MFCFDRLYDPKVLKSNSRLMVYLYESGLSDGHVTFNSTCKDTVLYPKYSFGYPWSQNSQRQ